MRVCYEPPFFLLNDGILVNLKYSTRGRSPWGFTFMPAEQALLEGRAFQANLFIGLICGSDGVAAFTYEAYRSIAMPRHAAIHIACYRGHGKHYDVSGPDGRLPSKVSPTDWERILKPEVAR